MRNSGMGFFSDEESLTRFTPGDDEARAAEQTINAHPLVAELRSRPELSESRPHMKMPASYRGRSLTAGALLGPRRLVLPPYMWLEEGGKSLVSVTYVGDDLCGHPGIVHGGLLATLLDEGLARCCFGALPHNIAVTASLSIDYRKPTPAGSFVVLRARTVRVEGRKAWVKGHLELLAAPGDEPTILAEATGLFVSPKYAAVRPLTLFFFFFFSAHVQQSIG
jgi:adenylylsulfate kinase